MINYKIQINYQIKIKQKNMWIFLFYNCNLIVTRVQLKDITHMFCL
jgi:hypothetical protein